MLSAATSYCFGGHFSEQFGTNVQQNQSVKMVMSRSTAVGSIVTGIIILTFAVVTVICGAISANKLSGQAAASAGLWSLFVSFKTCLYIEYLFCTVV